MRKPRHKHNKIRKRRINGSISSSICVALGDEKGYQPSSTDKQFGGAVCDVFAELCVKASYDWLTPLCSCFMLMSPAFSQPFSLRHKHSIGIRRTKRVRSACAYAYAYVLVSSLAPAHAYDHAQAEDHAHAHAHSYAYVYQVPIVMLIPSAYDYA